MGDPAPPVGRLGYAAVGRVSDRETVGARSGKSSWGHQRFRYGDSREEAVKYGHPLEHVEARSPLVFWREGQSLWHEAAKRLLHGVGIDSFGDSARWSSSLPPNCSGRTLRNAAPSTGHDARKNSQKPQFHTRSSLPAPLDAYGPEGSTYPPSEPGGVLPYVPPPRSPLRPFEGQSPSATRPAPPLSAGGN